MVSAVLFDLDDTLVDQTSAMRSACVSWARPHGVTGTDDEIADRWQSVSERYYDQWRRKALGWDDQRRRRVREFLELHELTDDEADRLFAGYLVPYEAAWKAYPDAIPTLRRLRSAGLKVGILTNGNHDHQTLKLQLTGLADEVDPLICASTLPAAKPAPEAFTIACEPLGSPPAETVMVGNSIDHDVLGALGGGLEAILLDRDGTTPPDDRYRTITALNQLLPHLH